MKIVISLSSSVMRCLWFGSALILFVGVIGFTLLWFVTSVVANPKMQVHLSTIESAASYFPNSAKLQARLAAKLVERGAETVESHESLAERAFRHSLRAVQLSPKNHEYRLLLAAAAELRGEMAIAEDSLREAVKLAPSDVHARWQMANLLLREGKIEESLVEFRVVAASDQLRLPIVMSLIWQATKGNFEMLDRTISQEPQARLALARFLAEQAQFDASARVFDQIDRESRFQLDGLGHFFDLMLSAGQWQWTGKLWRETVAGEKYGDKELFWNGSFDQPVTKSLAQFDWQLNHSNFARLEVAAGKARTGQNALTIAYQGRDTTRLDGEAQHPVTVQPGGKYRLEFFAKSEELVTPDGPRVEILRVDNRAVIASSAPAPAGSSDWERMVVEFTAPANAYAVTVAVRQTPQFSYAEPTFGLVRFDDFSLTIQ